MFSTYGPEKGFRLPFVRRLMIALSRHLAGAEVLSDSELLLVKSWLLQQAELCTPGYFVTLEESESADASQPDRLRSKRGAKIWAVVGKSYEREPVVWHPPLPWTLAQSQSSLF